MHEFITTLREFGTVSVVIRILLASVCGALIGLERESMRRPAGFRTHILICLGSAMTGLTSQFLVSSGWFTDPARIAAQVVAGMGFIGAGTIIVTRRRQVKGLTTAAGLWTSAIIGIAIGFGYYEAGLLATVIVLIAEIILSKLEWFIAAKSKNLNIYVEYLASEHISEIVRELKKRDVTIIDIEMTKSKAEQGSFMSAIFVLRMSNKTKREDLFAKIQEIKGIITVEEL